MTNGGSGFQWSFDTDAEGGEGCMGTVIVKDVSEARATTGEKSAGHRLRSLFAPEDAYTAEGFERDRVGSGARGSASTLFQALFTTSTDQFDTVTRSTLADILAVAEMREGSNEAWKQPAQDPPAMQQQQPRSPYPDHIDDVLDNVQPVQQSFHQITLSDSCLNVAHSDFDGKQDPTNASPQPMQPMQPMSSSFAHLGGFEDQEMEEDEEEEKEQQRREEETHSKDNTSPLVPTQQQHGAHSIQPSNYQRPKNLFEIRNMNVHSKKAFSALMQKMGAACNMRYNQELQCWEESGEISAVAAAADGDAAVHDLDIDTVSPENKSILGQDDGCFERRITHANARNAPTERETFEEPCGSVIERNLYLNPKISPVDLVNVQEAASSNSILQGPVDPPARHQSHSAEVQDVNDFDDLDDDFSFGSVVDHSSVILTENHSDLPAVKSNTINREQPNSPKNVKDLGSSKSTHLQLHQPLKPPQTPFLQQRKSKGSGVESDAWLDHLAKKASNAAPAQQIEEDRLMGLSFLDGIDSAINSLDEIQIPRDNNVPVSAPDVTKPNERQHQPHISPLPHFSQQPQTTYERAVVTTDSQDTAAQYILGQIEPDQSKWNRLLELNMDDCNLFNLKGLNQLASNVMWMSVCRNQIAYFDGAPEFLTTLIATHNRVSNISSFCHLKSLKHADLSSNNLSDLESLKKLKALTELNVAKNSITALHLVAGDFESLSSLDISNNQLRSVSISEAAAPNLLSLYIEHNVISQLHIESSSLRKLHVENNQLTASIDLQYCRQLKVLNLGENLLDSVPELLPRMLEDVYMHQQMESTRFTRLCALESHFVCLKTINVSGCSLDSLNIFLACRGTLTTLVARKCSVRRLPGEFASYMECLRNLKLSGNQISDITNIKHMQSLISLDLRFNDITNFKHAIRALQHLVYLETLDLRYNPITVSFYEESRANDHVNKGQQLGKMSESVNGAGGLVGSTSPEMRRPARERRATGGSLDAQVGRGILEDSAASAVAFAVSDKEFKRSLSDEMFVKRHCYRALLAKNGLRVLDGIVVDGRERRKGDTCLKVLGKQLSGSKK
ncbi:hypothetical protein CcCBS67573_g03346 [Chytriomyces confervae]|uniref:Uncharacterized protein n=1 Tax=Chytriomyces confervae TaxID=246404 RepID=A0A507FGJ3_9FUNG|nr:hypothetical protein HDU80_001928 [Chytriomyces hyalinus]TPX75374.1 hypothetical protein CcCBS67573_g03346 [Chytriomyces confervae]